MTHRIPICDCDGAWLGWFNVSWQPEASPSSPVFYMAVHNPLPIPMTRRDVLRSQDVERIVVEFRHVGRAWAGVVGGDLEALRKLRVGLGIEPAAGRFDQEAARDTARRFSESLERGP